MRNIITMLIIAFFGVSNMDALGQASIDLSLNQQLNSRVSMNIDFSINSFNTIDESTEQRHMRLAPSFNSSGGLNYRLTKGLYGIVNYQLMKEPMPKEESARPDQGYFILDTGIAYKTGQIQIALSLGRAHKPVWYEEQFDIQYSVFDAPDLIPETPSFRTRLQTRLSIGIML